jgi:hypothetical protein
MTISIDVTTSGPFFTGAVKPKVDNCYYRARSVTSI